jgi:hypothetical protein
MVAGPHTSVCTSSLKFWAGGLIQTLGMGRRVVHANMQALQSVSKKLGSSSTPTMAPLSTSFWALVAAMWPRHRCNSMTDTGSTALVESKVCTTLYRCLLVQVMHPTFSPCGEVRSRWQCSMEGKFYFSVSIWYLDGQGAMSYGWELLLICCV